MIHHDARSYDVAVGAAAKHFTEKIETMIHSSVGRVTGVIEQVENDVPNDALVLGKKLVFAATQNGVALLPPAHNGNANPDALTIHDHAFQQVCERPGIKNLPTVMRELNARGSWGQELVAENLSRIYSHFNGDRFLLRSVRGQVRGFLSDKFRRLDSRPLLDAFVQAIQRYGARPIDGFALQTKMRLRAILPMVFEPVHGEIMAFGAQLADSDFGDGKLAVSGFCLRMYCTNLATTEDVLNQVHLGRKLSDSVEFSTHTLQLDTATMASAVNDVVGHVLAPAAINRHIGLVKQAAEEKIAPEQIHTWVKKNLTGEEREKAVSKFTSPDVEMLPPGQTKWRWSNALSWLANETTDERRKLELQDFAGTILKPKQ
jgi:hypothetical protein